MRIGVPKEIKNHEYRVGLIPSSVRELIMHGHQILIETQAAAGIGISDKEYQQAGAIIVDSASEIFAKADLVVKVKEPQPNEYKLCRPDQLLFTFLHLAPDPNQAKALLVSGCAAIAYETITDTQGKLPLLSPMSEVAGRMSVQEGAHALEKAQQGRGILLGGVAGVAPGKIVVIGAGVVGSNAIRTAIGIGANVIVLDNSLARLQHLDFRYGSAITTLYATQDAIFDSICQADIVIGAVLVPGDTAPKLVSKSMLSQMKKGAVLVDVAIDQGGCFETSVPTTHTQPTYVVDDIVHYCVTNMPGAVPRTSTFALNNASLPFIIELANKGLQSALLENEHLRAGLNIYQGKITHPAVAKALKMPFHSPRELLAKR